ncbi:MAG TPA: arylamine N-acetyltransferase [Solirubrobacteraceae bacterium]|jgi:N-hydroxyarylamine O-acetyltransferase
MFDLDAYLRRIGLAGRPGIREVHRAHVTSIPFENLDPHRGVAVSLDRDAIARKIVGEGRGGYCFEQNLLLKAALEALGWEVELYLARVRYNAGGVVRPRSHLVLRASSEGEVLHADVGFGLASLFDPLPWGPGEEHEQLGWRFRLVDEGEELVLQTVEEEGWIDVYGFPPRAVPFIDVETSNWWVSTHPNSPFVTGLMASIQNDDGRRTSLRDWSGLALTEQTPGGKTMTEIDRGDVPGLLASRFGLSGFELDSGDRIVLAEES